MERTRMEKYDDYKLSIVVPVYNEENGIEPFLERTEKVMEELSCDYEIIFSLDPSTDDTYEVIKRNMKRNKNIKLITMSRRFRQAAATMAGVLNCEGDICVVIDVDLQDPPEVIPELVEKWKEGYDVVYAQRIDRQGETKIRKLIDLTAYRVINFLSSVEIPVDTADFRLINRKVIEELRKMPETNMFFRGMVSYIGFKQTAVRYHREARAEDESKYNRLWGEFRMGFHGIFCFSSKPLEYVTFLGAFITGIGTLLSLIWFIQKKILKAKETIVSGTAALIWFIGGIQVFVSGLLGEYVTRIYDDVKGRQRFIIDEFDKNE
ncbi:MAG: glycosyltransferase family 2 protein [Lachnospiraceae bacterium]|nr:glycosyltransferase family 2 protein [Lachnospiraceae bacterium]